MTMKIYINGIEQNLSAEREAQLISEQEAIKIKDEEAIENAKANALIEQEKQASAKSKLLALGLTEEEIKLTFGI